MKNPPERQGMLEDPDLSRQWVLRRLQRALALDRAGAALRRGISSTARGPARDTVARYAEHAQARAAAVADAIGRSGGVPYSSVGLARAASRAGGTVLGLLGARAWAPLVLRLAQHTLSEYESLAALLKDAPGVPAEMAATVEPLVEGIAHETAEISGL